MSLDYPAIDVDQLPDLLDLLDSDLPYKEWSKIGRALYVEFGDSAFDAFDAWSSTGSSYHAKRVRSFWKNFRRTAKVSFGSFIAELQKTGWKPERKALSDADKTQLQAKKAQRQAKQKAQRAKQAIAQQQALARSEQAFNQLQAYTEPSIYFLDKHMHDAHKLIELRQGYDKFGQHFIAWPIWSELGNKGQFCGFERILDKKINWHDKWLNKFSSDDAATDLGFATLGDVQDITQIKRIFVVGGLADAYAAHITTGEIVVTPIGEGNIANIVSKLQKAHPQLQIIAGPDNDKQGQYTIKACYGPWTLPNKPGADWSDVWLKEGSEALKNQLLHVRGFTHIKSNERYLTAQIRAGLNLLKSGMGTGKSENVKRYIADNPEQSVLVISHRKSLANDLKTGINAFISHQNTTDTEQAAEIQYYEDLILKNPGFGINENTPLRSAKRLVISIDSLWRLAGSHFDIIFVDEIEQGLGHFFAETNRHAEHCFNMFRFFMTHSHTQILADAHLGTLTTDFCADNNLHSGVLYDNSYQVGQGRTLYLYENKNQLTEYYHQQILANERVYVYSNSKAEIKTLATSVRQHIERKHCQPNLIEIHADSVKNDSHTMAAIQNIAHAAPNIDTLLASPTLGTGFDIPAYKVNADTGQITGHQFSQTFGILNSHVGTAEEGHQGINRARDINEYHLYIDPTERSEPINADYIYQNLIENVSSETAALLKIDPDTGDWAKDNQAYEHLYAKVKARQNLSKNAYKIRFIELARLDGYKIVEVAKNEVACEFGKMTRNEARERNQRQTLRDTNAAKLHLDHASDVINGISLDECRNDADTNKHGSDSTYDNMNRNHDQYTATEINKSKVCKSLNLLAASGDDINDLYPIAKTVYSEFSRPGPNAKFNPEADKAVPMPSNKHQAVINALAFLQDTQRYVSQVTKLSLLSLSDCDAKKLDLNNIKNAQSRVKWEHRAIKKRHLTKLLAIAGINEQLEYDGTTWTKEQLKAQLLGWLEANQDNLYKYSKIKLSHAAKTDPVQWFNSHLRSYGIPVESLGQARSQGGRARRYGLNQSLWRQIQILVRLRNQGIAQHLAASEQTEQTNTLTTSQSVTPLPSVSNNQSGQGVPATSPIATGFSPQLAPHFPHHDNQRSEKRANALLSGSAMLKNDLKEEEKREAIEKTPAALTKVAKTLANLIDIAVNQVKLPLTYVQEQLTKQREYWQQALADPLISLQQWAMTLKELYLYDCQPNGAEAARLEAFCFE